MTLEPEPRFIVLQAEAGIAPSCVDAATNLPPVMPLRSLQNSSVITSLTTLVTVMMERPGSLGPDINLELAAVQALRTTFALPEDFDPMFDDCLEILGRSFPVIEQEKYDAAAQGLVVSSQVLLVAVHAASVAAGLSGGTLLRREVASQAFAAIVAETGWAVLPQHVYGNETDAGKPRQLDLTNNETVSRIISDTVRRTEGTTARPELVDAAVLVAVKSTAKMKLLVEEEWKANVFQAYLYDEVRFQHGTVSPLLWGVGNRTVSLQTFFKRIADPQPPLPPPPPDRPAPPHGYLSHPPPPPEIMEDSVWKLGGLRLWELCAVILSPAVAIILGYWLTCFIKRRFFSDSDDSEASEQSPLMKDLIRRSKPKAKTLLADESRELIKFRESPIYGPSAMMSSSRKLETQKPRHMLKWDSKRRRWKKHEVAETDAEAEKEEERLLQLANVAMGSGIKRQRPAQPDPAIPAPPPRGAAQLGFSGGPAGAPGPPSPDKMPTFRKRRLPLKRSAVALMSIEELCAALDSRGINREDCFTREELVELLQLEACLPEADGPDTRTLEQPDLWFS